VFFNKQQELLLLTIIKTEKAQKKEIEQLYVYKNNCDEQLLKEQKHSEDLNKAFTSMEVEAKLQREKYITEKIEHEKTKVDLQTQTNKKKNWRNLALGSILVNGILTFLIFH